MSAASSCGVYVTEWNVSKWQCTQQRAMITAYLKQTGRQLLQLLLQLIPDLRQTLTLLVFQFQFLKWEEENVTISLNEEGHLHCQLFFLGHTMHYVWNRLQHTLFAASSCSLRISEPFSRISFSLISSEELRSRERSPCSLAEVGTACPPPSTLDSGSGSRSTNLHGTTNKNKNKINMVTDKTLRFHVPSLLLVADCRWLTLK